jgi:DNA gyrase subunit B
MHAGTAFISRHTALVGRFGIGLCVPNALSSRLTAEVMRDGVRWVQEYVRGVATGPPTAVGPATGSGTSLTFQADTEIFASVQCAFDHLADRFRELAFLNHGLDITLTDQRPHPPRTQRLYFPGGTRDFVALLDTAMGTPVHPDVIGFEHEDPRMAGTTEVSLRWHATPEEQLLSFANSRPTPHGGTHALGFRDGVAAAITAYARRQGLLPPTVPDLTLEQIGTGLAAVVSVKLDAPEFEGATRGILGNAAVRPCVAEAVRDHLIAWLDDHPDQAAALTHPSCRSPPAAEQPCASPAVRAGPGASPWLRPCSGLNVSRTGQPSLRVRCRPASSAAARRTAFSQARKASGGRKR